MHSYGMVFRLVFACRKTSREDLSGHMLIMIEQSCHWHKNSGLPTPRICKKEEQRGKDEGRLGNEKVVLRSKWRE